MEVVVWEEPLLLFGRAGGGTKAAIEEGPLFLSGKAGGGIEFASREEPAFDRTSGVIRAAV
jgi:hypothetical protein